MVLDAFTRGRLTPLGIAAIYLVFGAVALFGSDVLLALTVDEPLLTTLQTVKGGLEVVVTAGFVYLLVRWSWRDFRLRERAIDAAPVGVTITEGDRPDDPIMFVNESFQELTGYDEDEILGRDWGFLRGSETDGETVATIEAAMQAGDSASVDLVNYRRNGAKFWNKLDVAPVRDADGTVSNFVGFHADITARKVREERLRVLNRVLRHNFRNKLTVIAGQVDLLRDRHADPPDSLDTIRRAVDDLESLTETVRMNEAVLEAAMESGHRLALDDQLRVVVDALEERYPGVAVSLELSEELVMVRSAGLIRAVEEAVENAVKHNESDSPTVEIRVECPDDDWVTVTVDDDGPGIPPSEVEVLTEGEQPLKHANRLGIWTIHWIVSLAGGSMEIDASELGGTRLAISVPRVAED